MGDENTAMRARFSFSSLQDNYHRIIFDIERIGKKKMESNSTCISSHGAKSDGQQTSSSLFPGEQLLESHPSLLVNGNSTELRCGKAKNYGTDRTAVSTPGET